LLDSEDSLKNFIINEFDYLNGIIQPLIETKNYLIKNEPRVFHDVIQEQFEDRLRNIIISEYTKSFTITPEEAIIILEEVNLEEFFKC
jgi:hypothetical protein